MFIECISNATSIIKGIWSDPLCKETNARFTASSKSLSVHPGQRTSCVYLSNSVKITVKSYCVLLYCMNTTKLTLLWSVKSPKGTVVNRTPHSTNGGSLSQVSPDQKNYNKNIILYPILIKIMNLTCHLSSISSLLPFTGALETGWTKT